VNARCAAISSSVEVAPPKQKHCIHACPQARPVHRRTQGKGRIPQQADNPPGSIDGLFSANSGHHAGGLRPFGYQVQDASLSSPRARRKSLHRPPLCRTRLGTIVERRARRNNQILANTCDHRSAARGCVQANLPTMPPSELDMTRELRRPHSGGSWCACGREPVRYAATVRRFRHGPNRRNGRAISLILHLAWARELLQRQCRSGYLPRTAPSSRTRGRRLRR
jgi:hypothetical protein